MRLATLKDGTVIAEHAGGTVALQEVGFKGSLLNLIAEGPAAWSELKQSLRQAAPRDAVTVDMYDAPILRPPKIIAIGLNYKDHAAESQMELPTSPLVFTKFSTSVTGPTDPILLPLNLTQQVDYEVELGVVIGKTAKNISVQDALEHVFGYTVINDVSARDLQFGDGQWVRGKSLDTFCPMGPVIVTADDIPDPQSLIVGCELRGEILQHASTSDMIFSVADIIAHLSNAFTLEPGDVIATGTPAGVGFSRRPPVYLQDGDAMRTWVEGIGELCNPVVAV